MLNAGRAAGRIYNRGGAGSNYLCLPEEPQWKNHTTGNLHIYVGLLYGVEYRTHNVHDVLLSAVNNAGSNQFHGQPTPCAVCYVPRRSASVMIPASISCPAGWTLEYGGYLMSEHSFDDNGTRPRHSTSHVCVDDAPEVGFGGVTQTQSGFIFVRVQCGSLSCSKFRDGWEVACIVCTK